MLLALSIHTVESTQAFMFYLIQYSISNLNAFILIITIGYSLYCYIQNDESTSSLETKDDKGEYSAKNKENLDQLKSISYKEMDKGEIVKDEKGKNEYIKETEKDNNVTDAINSPIQLIDQLKGYYYINPIISLSLGITLFSFAGIPPLIGFFGKQMILSAAVDSGYIFMSLVAILTSVVSAVYYLAIIKQIFFDKPDYSLNKELKDFNADGLITEKSTAVEKVSVQMRNIVISSSLSLSISVITLIITLFIFIPQEILSFANILSLILFNL